MLHGFTKHPKDSNFQVCPHSEQSRFTAHFSIGPSESALPSQPCSLHRSFCSSQQAHFPSHLLSPTRNFENVNALREASSADNAASIRLATWALTSSQIVRSFVWPELQARSDVATPLPLPLSWIQIDVRVRSDHLCALATVHKGCQDALNGPSSEGMLCE